MQPRGEFNMIDFRFKYTRICFLMAWSVFMLVLLPFSAPVAAATVQKNENKHFDFLKRKLIRDGFDACRINALYSQPQTKFDTKGVSLFFVHNEASLNYDQFLSEKSIQQAKAYMRTHNAELMNAAQTHGVDPTIITAIILVETRLGTFVGRRSIFNTLSTIASLEDKHMRKLLWNSISDSRRFSKTKFHQRADKKAKWAYKELKAFLKYTEHEGIEAVSVCGSYAGAMGIAQFMPSNVLLLGKDGNRDGRIDLFNHADAIASIANFLQYYNWRPGISRQEAYKILLNYNYSKYYVNTLLNISDRLKG